MTTKNDSVTQDFIDSIILYCSKKQLVEVHFESFRVDDYYYKLTGRFRKTIEFPILLRNVEKFHFTGHYQPNISLSDSLRVLYLKYITFHPNFNWTKLTNLTEIYLKSVNGFNKQNFIEFLRQRPKLKSFYHKQIPEESMQNIGELMAEYCGDFIQVFYDVICYRGKRSVHPNFYNFLSGFKNLKKVALSTHQECGHDLIYPIKNLAENDTLEILIINHCSIIEYHICAFYNHNGTRYKKISIKPFSNLKSIRIHGRTSTQNQCDHMKILTIYSTEILSNVENVIIEASVNVAYK